MKNYLIIAALAGLASVASAQTVVYDNTVTALPNFWGQSAIGSATGFEGGDRMALTNNDRKLTNIELRFNDSSTITTGGPLGTVELRLRFYENTPLNNPVAFYDAGWVTFPTQAGLNTYNWTLPNVQVPNVFTYTIEIQNRTDLTGAFGPIMFNPVAIGGSQTSFVFKNLGTTWGLFGFAAPAVGNFGAKLTALAGDPIQPTPPAGLYTQNPAATFAAGHSTSSVQGFLDTANPGNLYDRQHTDDFTVPSGGWTLASVGAWYQNDRGNPTSFNVEFFDESSPGIPNEVAVHSFTNIAMSNVTEYYSGVFNGNGLRHYRVNLPSNVTLPAGKWFVKIQPNSNFNHFWNATTPTNAVQGLNAHYRSGPLGFDLLALTPWPSTWTQTGPSGLIFTTVSDRAFRLYGPASFTATGTVDFGQLGGSPYNSGTNLPTSIPVSFRDASNTEIATGTATYNPLTGAFSATVPGSVTVPYRVSFKHGFWLRKTMPNPVDPAAPVGNYAFGTVAPQVGDADDDNAVTPSDYGIWQAENGTFPTENTSADFDGDGAVTPSDYGLWQINNGAFGDD